MYSLGRHVVDVVLLLSPVYGRNDVFFFGQNLGLCPGEMLHFRFVIVLQILGYCSPSSKFTLSGNFSRQKTKKNYSLLDGFIVIAIDTVSSRR